MKYFIRKVWYSALLSILIIATAFTTTYAWYAMTYNNDIEEFGFNISGSNSVFISTNGKDFKTSLTSLEVEKAILQKRGINVDVLSDAGISEEMDKIKLDSVTPNDYTDLSKGFNKVLKGETANSNSYLSFDIYLSSDYVSNSNSGQSIYFAADKTISAKNKNVNLTYFNVGEHPTLGNLNKTIMVNVENACRIGISKHEVTSIGNLESSVLTSTKIYEPGSEVPSVTDGVYNFGGINATPNVALEYYNGLMNENLAIPENDRVDYEINSNAVISSDDLLTDGNMIKLEIYVWLEGWDADCFDIFKGDNFDLSLAFATYQG